MEKIEEQHNLNGKVAIITGAGAGIGRASAIMLAKAGADIVCSDLNPDFAQEVVKEIEALGRKAIAVKCDVTSEEDLINLVDETVKNFGTVNILVNNAGGGGGGREKFTELSREYITKIYALNTFSVFTLSKLCVPHMKKSGYGSIINITSMAGTMQSHNMSVYGSSKAATNQLTKYMAFDLGPEIRVNGVAPGAIKTRALASVLTEEIERKMLSKTPLKVLGEADDIAMTVLYLATPLSKWTSGQIIAVNGGGEQELDL